MTSRKRLHPKFTFVVPTLGRPTLTATLGSIATQAWTGDEVIVVTAPTAPVDTVERIVSAASKGARCDWRILNCINPGPGRGDAERNLGQKHAQGSHVAFMDDDDVYQHRALAALRKASWVMPTIYRMDATNHGLGILWREPVLRYANISTQMMVVPNNKNLPQWAPYEGTEACDFVFAERLMQQYGEFDWREDIVATLRPTPRDDPAPFAVGEVVAFPNGSAVPERRRIAGGPLDGLPMPLAEDMLDVADSDFQQMKRDTFLLVKRRLKACVNGTPGKKGTIADNHLFALATNLLKAEQTRKRDDQDARKPAAQVNMLSLVSGLPQERAAELLTAAVRELEAAGRDATEQRAALGTLVGSDASEKLLAIEGGTDGEEEDG